MTENVKDKIPGVITKIYPHFTLKLDGTIEKNHKETWIDVARDLFSDGSGFYGLRLDPRDGQLLSARRSVKNKQMRALDHRQTYYRGTRVWTLEEARKSPHREKLLRAVNAGVHAGVVQCGDRVLPLFLNDIVFDVSDPKLPLIWYHPEEEQPSDTRTQAEQPLFDPKAVHEIKIKTEVSSAKAKVGHTQPHPLKLQNHPKGSMLAAIRNGVRGG